MRSKRDLERVDALVIPGGESTAVMKLIGRAGLEGPIAGRTRDGMPLWGTCMGMIVASNGVDGSDQPTLGLLDVTVRRNAFGRQAASAEVPLHIPAIGEVPFPAIFIRAPWIERAGGGVDVLASVDAHPVFVRQGNIIGTSFHPELTPDSRIHAYFLRLETAQAGTTRTVRRDGV